MVLSPINEISPLHIQTRFTPNSSRHHRKSGKQPHDTNHDAHVPTDDRPTMPHPFSTRNVANATGPLSTTSIVFSMNGGSKNRGGSPQQGGRNHFFATPMARQNGFNDIFRKWEDGSVKSQGSGGSVSSRRSQASKNSRKSQGSLQGMKEERGYRNHQSLHRRIQSESTIPRMDDWVMNKLDKYEKFKNEVKKIELSPPKKQEKAISPQEKKKDAEKKPPKKELYERIEQWQHKRRSLQQVREEAEPDKQQQQQHQHQQQRDDVADSRPSFLSPNNRHRDKEAREPPRQAPTHHDETDDYERTMQYYRTMGLNETLQTQIKIKSHEISTLHRKLEDMEQWYQSHVEEMEQKHREEVRILRIQYEKEEKHAIQMLENQLNSVRLEGEKREKEWMESKARMEKEILLLTGENRSYMVEVRDLQTRKDLVEQKNESLEKEVQSIQNVREENRRLTEEVTGYKVEMNKIKEEKEKAEGYCESLEKDLKYQKSERQKMESLHQSRISSLIDERQREKELHQAMVANLMKEHEKEKERAFHEANHELEREKAAHQATVANLMKEHEKEKERAFHEADEWKMRLHEEREKEKEQSFHEANEWKMRVQSIKRELEEEMTRNAAMAKEKNAMADMMEGYVSKMEEMHHHIRELKNDKRELMDINNELEAKNTRLSVLTKEKDALESVLEGYGAQMAALQKRNDELERETMLLKEELIDVLEVASRYQE
ncbi:hypothetical protein ACHAWX_006329 [Stephanocyclus meneghinianus]